jgi:hypothetical protein
MVPDISKNYSVIIFKVELSMKEHCDPSEQWEVFNLQHCVTSQET